MIIGVSGHRRLGSYDVPNNPVYLDIKKRLTKKLLELKPDVVITGMAIGCDILTAEICVEHNIPFVAAIPFEGQTNAWSDKDRDNYNMLLTKAKQVIMVTEGGYENWKYQARNEWIVDNCDELVAVYDMKTKNGGTKNTMKYAWGLNKRIHLIQFDNKKD